MRSAALRSETHVSHLICGQVQGLSNLLISHVPLGLRAGIGPSEPEQKSGSGQFFLLLLG